MTRVCISLDAVSGMIWTVLPITWYQICMTGSGVDTGTPAWVCVHGSVCLCVFLAVQLQVSLQLSSWHTDVVVGTCATHIHAQAHTHTHYGHYSRKNQYPESVVAKRMNTPRSWCCRSAVWLVVVRHEMVLGAGFRLPEDYNVDSTFHAARTLQPEITQQNTHRWSRTEFKSHFRSKKECNVQYIIMFCEFELNIVSTERQKCHE